MWLVVVELFLEGLLTPFLAAAFFLGAARLVDQQHSSSLVPAFAIALSVVIAGLLAFGWPVGWTLTARTKILISAIIGVALGALYERRIYGSRLITALGLIGIAIWIGEPTLRQERWDSALLLLPLVAGLLFLTPPRGSHREIGESRLLITLVLAFGLATIAALAKALSYSLLSLALASALLAILTVGRSRFPPSATLSADATMLALTTALLLYTEVSPLALLVLCTSLAAERLAHLTWRHGGPPPRHLVLAYCIAPTLLAILIARIDAGAISIY